VWIAKFSWSHQRPESGADFGILLVKYDRLGELKLPLPTLGPLADARNQSQPLHMRFHAWDENRGIRRCSIVRGLTCSRLGRSEQTRITHAGSGGEAGRFYMAEARKNILT
jgi:hypothetical protein